MLSALRCPTCGWERPAAGQIGETVWSRICLKAGLGGPGRHVFAQAALAQGVVVFPMNNREIAGLALSDGKERWCTFLGEGLVTRQLVAEGKHILLTRSDERAIGQAGVGELTSLDPVTGQMTTLWQANGHQLSAPVLSDKYILLRTSDSELVAFSRMAKPELIWRVQMNTWWALPPHVTAGKVLICDGFAMQGEGWLKAFELDSGQPAWSKPTDGMLSQPLTSCGKIVIFQNGKKQILALNLENGAQAWSLSFERLYTPPVAGGGRVFFVARGAAQSDQPDHYLLKALDPVSGKTLWEAPLPARVLISPVWQDERVYLASEDGRLFAYQDKDGLPVFELKLSNEDDPPRTELLIAEGILFLGTYSGKIAAIRVAQSRQAVESPQVYLEHGDFESAAAAFALQGNFSKAASLYADELRDFTKALMLCDHAGLFKQAAVLCDAQGLLAEAERYYEKAGDALNQAEMLLKRGDELGAARVLDQIGKLARAARLYEHTGEFTRALELYRQLADEASILRVSMVIPPSSQVVELLIAHGKLAEAAEAALKAGLSRRAADLFQRLGQENRELDALLQLSQEESEEWVFERIAGLAKKAGRFFEEARAWENLNRPQKTAEAYQHAGMQAEQKKLLDLARIVEFYEKAAQNYLDCDGFSLEEAQCREAAAKLQHLPIIQIQGQTLKEFKETEWNKLDLNIHNIGYGVAKQVRWKVTKEHFDVDQDTGVWILNQLGTGAQKDVSIHVRPQKGEIGEAVPFYLEWVWQNAAGQEFRDRISVSVPVKGKDDSRPTGQPVIINSGTIIQAEKYVSGDDLTGGHKGDEVNIQRGGGLNISAAAGQVRTSRPAAGRPCPTCQIPNDADAKNCNYCGNKLVA